MPKPSGGFEPFFDWIKANNMLYNTIPADQKENRVVINCIVDTTGKLTELRIIKGLGDPFDNESIRLLKECPIKWEPGFQRGEPVLCYAPITVFFSDYRPSISNQKKRAK